MEIGFKRNMNGSCMVISGPYEQIEDTYSLNMLLRNKIRGLLDVSNGVLNGCERMEYNISSLQSLSGLFEICKLNKTQVDSLFDCLLSCAGQLSEYLLDAEGLILRAECIFADLNRERFYFCYHPFYHDGIRKDLRELMDMLLSNIDYADPVLVRQVFAIHSLVFNENFSMNELAGLLENKDELPVREMFDFPEQGQRTDSYVNSPQNNKKNIGGVEPGNANPIAIKIKDTKTPLIWNDHTEKQASPERKEINDKENGSGGFISNLKSYMKGNTVRDMIADIDNKVLLRKINGSGKDTSGQDLKNRILKEDIIEGKTGFNTEKKEEEDLLKNTGNIFGNGLPQDLRIRYMDPDPEDFINTEYSSKINPKVTVDTDIPVPATTILKSPAGRERKLVGIALAEGRIVELKKFPFSVGKLGSADYILQEAAVSRIHARIHQAEEENIFYVEDMNSANGTYINGVRINPYTKEIIHPGDLICLADQEFVFR